MVGVPCFSTMWRCGAVGADRLAPPLLHLEQRDDARPEQEDEDEGGEDGKPRARRLIAEDVEERDFVGEAGQQKEKHQDSLESGGCAALIASTSGPMRLPSEPLIITTSPGLRPASRASRNASDVAA
jgi:hypothetical protein